MESSDSLIPFHHLTFVAHSWGERTRQSHCLVRRAIISDGSDSEFELWHASRQSWSGGYRILMTHKLLLMKCLRMVTFWAQGKAALIGLLNWRPQATCTDRHAE